MCASRILRGRPRQGINNRPLLLLRRMCHPLRREPPRLRLCPHPAQAPDLLSSLRPHNSHGDRNATYGFRCVVVCLHASLGSARRRRPWRPSGWRHEPRMIIPALRRGDEFRGPGLPRGGRGSVGFGAFLSLLGRIDGHARRRVKTARALFFKKTCAACNPRPPTP
jgi:hypothetical protein